ncbi:MAG: type II toxin-antitoxin system Phd/YefM family antitoxin [Deltaproteobacteria bacterium]|nr:type II toxin-antitoxin system Phd/YefM family antitoxin [Deltaproteobacteria bacterium]
MKGRVRRCRPGRFRPAGAGWSPPEPATARSARIDILAAEVQAGPGLVWRTRNIIAGACEARTHLSDLLDRVAPRERVTISRHGVPVAVLQPPDPAARTDVNQAIANLRWFRQSRRAERRPVARAEIREWIEEERD